MTTFTAFILGCWTGVLMLGVVIFIVYRDDIWPE
jgi:hypothetical protein